MKKKETFNARDFYTSSATIPVNAIKQLKKYGVSAIVHRGDKKLMIYDKAGDFICAIGSAGCMDFHLYQIGEDQGIFPRGTAIKKRGQYLARAGRKKKSDNPQGYYSQKILWTFTKPRK